MTGVMMVSSGMLCSVIHVVSTAFFELRPGALFSAKAAGEQFNGDCDSLSCRNDKIFNTFFNENKKKIDFDIFKENHNKPKTTNRQQFVQRN